MKTLNLIFLKKLMFICLNLGLMLSLSACPDSGSSSHPVTASQPAGYPDYNSQQACQNQVQLNPGIIGNSYCPYKGNLINGQLEAFAYIQFNGRIEIDFGTKYNDACPAGRVPVYEYVYHPYYGYQKQLTRCDYIGGSYVDNIFFQHHNSSNCAGAYAGDVRCIPN